MNLNDYEALWKRQELPVGEADDMAKLRNTFETKNRKQAATLFVRDLLEGLAGLLVSAVLAYIWWHIGPNGWPLSFAIALVLGVSGFFARERFRVRRLRLAANATLLAKVEGDLTELRHQRRLLLNLWSWYLLPLAGAMVIVVVTVARLLPADILAALQKSPAALAWIIGYFVLVVPLCFWGAWWLNRRAVRKQIDPRIIELEKLRDDLLSSTS